MNETETRERLADLLGRMGAPDVVVNGCYTLPIGIAIAAACELLGIRYDDLADLGDVAGCESEANQLRFQAARLRDVWAKVRKWLDD